ncbi:MAG: hypothetical protein AAFX93_06630 [Verrucomicrobiota bacterium]
MTIAVFGLLIETSKLSGFHSWLMVVSILAAKKALPFWDAGPIPVAGSVELPRSSKIRIQPLDAVRLRLVAFLVLARVLPRGVAKIEQGSRVEIGEVLAGHNQLSVFLFKDQLDGAPALEERFDTRLVGRFSHKQ